MLSIDDFIRLIEAAKALGVTRVEAPGGYVALLPAPAREPARAEPVREPPVPHMTSAELLEIQLARELNGGN